nr:MAG TPA: hypothetical protein [Caudoviricetes sp.]
MIFCHGKKLLEISHMTFYIGYISIGGDIPA